MKSVYTRLKDPKIISKLINNIKDISNKNSLNSITPPDIFIGRIGYPYVSIGPLFGNDANEILAKPEYWVHDNLDDIIMKRISLFRGLYKVKINDIENKEVIKLSEAAISYRKIDGEFHIGKVTNNLLLDERSLPFGPGVKLNDFYLYNTNSDKRLENAYYDIDANANDIVFELYNKGVEVSSIQRLFSIGGLGIKKNRKLVPTRWSITAVDDIISKRLIEKSKEFNLIDHIELFSYSALDNHWLIFFIPGTWEYEVIEAWYPNETWNISKEIEIESSYEPYYGRNTYAEITGSYYAAKLAIGEYLNRINKQAKVLILREVREGYKIPVGVWNIREHIRDALKQKPIILNELNDAITIINRFMRLKFNVWLEKSKLLKNLIYQRRLFV